MENVRLWSATLRREDSRWRVEPGDAKGADRAFRLLAEYMDAEPDAGWRLETRGDTSGWHVWTR